MTAGQLEDAIAGRLRPYVLEPEVSVSITDFRSGPVSVLGSVKNPGVYQVQGHKTVAEVLSLAGGPDAAAGSVVKITREAERGPIPIDGASSDSSGKFNVAEISLVSILKADQPRDNIAIQAHDIVSVPRAEMVYVIGEVQRAGGFVLTDGKAISLLQALTLAGGLDKLTALTVALCYVLVPRAGAVGAAQAILLTGIVQALVMACALYRALGQPKKGVAE